MPSAVGCWNPRRHTPVQSRILLNPRRTRVKRSYEHERDGEHCFNHGATVKLLGHVAPVLLKKLTVACITLLLNCLAAAFVGKR